MGLELPVWGAPTAVWVITMLGLVGASVLDRFLDDDGSDDADDAGGMDDDLFGGGGGGAAGDGFDDFDGMDEWDDEFEDEGGSDTDELEKRIDDLEAEVASLSSTVSTVRSENEEISGTVEDIEEDVRNLLDIYEMVTRGINPFVDESSGFDEMSGGGEGSFGLFDDGEADDDDPELDEDVASADADGFFDEDLIEPGDDDGFDDLEDDGFGDLEDDGLDDLEDDGFDDLDDPEESGDGSDGDAADADGEPAGDGDDMNQDGKSFSELKEEYDAGEADWADDGAETDADDDDPFDDDGSLADDGSLDDAFDDEVASDDDSADDGGTFDGGPDEPSTGPRPGGDPAEANGDGFEYVQQDDLSGSRRKPYLTELPGDYVGDLLVMEWLEFLVSASDVTDAVRAINYYERIEWISEDAADGLRDFLSGFGTIDRNLVDQPGTDRLVRDHHTRSLRYITQLNGTSAHTVLLDRWDDLAGGSLVGGVAPDPFPRGRGGGGRQARDRSRGATAGNGTHRRDAHHGQSPERRSGETGSHPADGNDPRPADGNDPRPAEDPSGPTDGTEATPTGHGGSRDRSDAHGGARDGSNGHDGRTEGRDRSTGRTRNGTSPRPMNDPNPRSDRADPADGGWDDGR